MNAPMTLLLEPEQVDNISEALVGMGQDHKILGRMDVADIAEHGRPIECVNARF